MAAKLLFSFFISLLYFFWLLYFYDVLDIWCKKWFHLDKPVQVFFGPISSFRYFFSLSHSLTYTHTPSHTPSLPRLHPHSFTYAHTLQHTISLTLPLTLPHTLTLTLLHTFTLPLTLNQALSLVYLDFPSYSFILPPSHSHIPSLPHTLTLTILGTVTGLSRGVFAVDFSPDGDHVAIAGGDAAIRIFQISS